MVVKLHENAPRRAAGGSSEDHIVTKQLATGSPALTAPNFYLTGREPLRPAAILMAFVAAGAGLGTISYALGRGGHARFASGNSAARYADAGPGGTSADGDKDDPSQVDVIALGDPADAPVPARPRARQGEHYSTVHPTILVHLPRFGEQVGLIPDTPAGHLLYRWLAAFNQASSAALADALPNGAPASTMTAQMELRQQTGGFNLLSAREVQAGVLVFRLRDQTPSATEVLGTLHVRADSSPATIRSFSLRAVPATPPETTGTSPQ